MHFAYRLDSIVVLLHGWLPVIAIIEADVLHFDRLNIILFFSFFCVCRTCVAHNHAVFVRRRPRVYHRYISTVKKLNIHVDDFVKRRITD